MAGKRRLTIAERFWTKVHITDTCWLWTARLNNKGYGCFSLMKSESPNRNIYAHRLAYAMRYGYVTFEQGPSSRFTVSLPMKMAVLHKCDNPLCCNPDHLFLGSQGENMRDRDAKGRVRHGSAHSHAKLTEDQVRAIRIDTRTQSEIAQKYHVGQACVSAIKRRTSWRRLA